MAGSERKNATAAFREHPANGRARPTAVAQEGRLSDVPTGIVRVTRHPFLLGVGLRASIHLIANGDAASIVFFGCFVLVSVAGPLSIDTKRRRLLGAERWGPFAAQTFILPFAAIAEKRTTSIW